MDFDTMKNYKNYKKILHDFSNHKYDVLLGTQMVSKGLDFKGVTLVGVINGDTNLYIPDFRSGMLICHLSANSLINLISSGAISSSIAASLIRISIIFCSSGCSRMALIRSVCSFFLLIKHLEKDEAVLSHVYFLQSNPHRLMKKLPQGLFR